MESQQQQQEEDSSNTRQQMQQRWQAWMQQRELQKELDGLQIQGLSENINQENVQQNKQTNQNPNNRCTQNSNENQKILTELTMKITQRFKEELSSQNPKPAQTQQIQLEKAISKEVETNTCPICFELMVPPNYSPILLFPCGHTFCKNCCFDKNTKTRKIDKCAICRCKIQSQALNLSLQNLICTYTNNRHLLEKYPEKDLASEQSSQTKATVNQQTENLEEFKNNYKLYELRCKILREEKNDMAQKKNSVQKELDAQQQVIDTMDQKKIECETKMKKLQEELKLILKFIQSNQEQKFTLQQQLQEYDQKIKLIDETIKPLEQEKQKYQLLANTCEHLD